jgi:hypothetical protein
MAESPDELDPVHVGECEVHHNDIHGRLTAKSQSSLALVCLDHFVAGAGDDPLQSSTHYFLPLHHQNALRVGILASLNEPATETCAPLQLAALHTRPAVRQEAPTRLYWKVNLSAKHDPPLVTRTMWRRRAPISHAPP